MKKNVDPKKLLSEPREVKDNPLPPMESPAKNEDAIASAAKKIELQRERRQSDGQNSSEKGTRALKWCTMSIIMKPLTVLCSD